MAPKVTWTKPIAGHCDNYCCPLSSLFLARSVASIATVFHHTFLEFASLYLENKFGKCIIVFYVPLSVRLCANKRKQLG